MQKHPGIFRKKLVCLEQMIHVGNNEREAGERERQEPHRKTHEYKVNHEVWILSYKQRNDTVKMLF